MNTKTVPEQLFFCVSEEVTREEIPSLAARAVGPLYEALAKAGLEQTGPLQFICPEWKGADAKNKLIIGIPIREEKSVPAPCFVWTAPAFHCVWKEHTGSMPSLKEAWNSFVEECTKEGVQPTGTWREIYKVWESFESEKNVTEIQMGIKEE
jgi:effector-binding domain-containing protein